MLPPQHLDEFLSETDSERPRSTLAEPPTLRRQREACLPIAATLGGRESAEDSPNPSLDPGWSCRLIPPEGSAAVGSLSSVFRKRAV